MSEVVVAFPAQSGKPRARQKPFFRKFALSNCVVECPLVALEGKLTQEVLFAQLRNSSVEHALDLVRSEILIYLCGATEPCGYLSLLRSS